MEKQRDASFWKIASICAGGAIVMGILAGLGVTDEVVFYTLGFLVAMIVSSID